MIYAQKFLGLSLLASAILFSSCDESVRTESVLNSDGSIDRIILLSKADSIKISDNIFGINAQKGWKTEIAQTDEGEKAVKDAKKNFEIKFTKHFPTIESANKEMDPEDESVFKIRTKLDKKFRWFYTYYDYSDTYMCLNRFHELSQDDYFTQEDLAFIERLPAEGKPMSKADSFYLQQLNSRIFDHYAIRAIYEENYKNFVESLKENNVDKKWIDTLALYKEDFFRNTVIKDEDLEDDFIFLLLRHIADPFSEEAIRTSYKTINADFDRRSKMMYDAAELKYTHVIRLPWKVMDTNADSLQGSVMVWNPPVTKFLLNDYTMLAQARSLNIWAVIVSLLIVFVTAFLYYRNRASI